MSECRGSLACTNSIQNAFGIGKLHIINVRYNYIHSTNWLVDYCYKRSTFTTSDPLDKGHFSNEDTVYSRNHIELYTNLPLN